MEQAAKRQKGMARMCANCILCRYARKRQKGWIYRIAKLESRICPFCRAYEKVYGRKSYEPCEV
ncbi:MAG: hypothetical protein KAY65_07070 [Planctomycetes bacterium]|nr:hypothetical protein [Planctomycetota bacterium]